MKIKFAGASDVGCVRSENQDTIFLPERQPEEGATYFFLADGMGGRSGGSVASQTAIQVLCAYFAAPKPELDAEQNLKQAIMEASQAIFDRAEQETDLRGMGTTVVAVAVEEDRATIANVGDSRCYLLRGGVLAQLTEDHSLVAQQVREGSLTPEEAHNHPMRNVLTRGAGAIREAEADLYKVHLKTDDYLLLCSDGLHATLDEVKINKTVSNQKSVRDNVDALIQKTIKAGAPDNVSVILIRVTENDEDESTLPEKDDTENLNAMRGFWAREFSRGWGAKLVLGALLVLVMWAIWWVHR